MKSDHASFRAALLVLCLECFSAGFAAAEHSWFTMAGATAIALIFGLIVWRNARRAIVYEAQAVTKAEREAIRSQMRAWLSKAYRCPHPGCTLTDGKPCAYSECPNREARS